MGAEGETNKEVAKFDPNTVMDGVKNKIKAEFVALLPDEQWTQLCQGVIDSFFKKKKINKGTGYSPEWVDGPSEFEEIAFAIFREKAKEEIKKMISDKYDTMMSYQYIDNNNVPVYQVSEKFEELIKQQMPVIFAAAMENMMKQGMSNFMSNLKNNGFFMQ